MNKEKLEKEAGKWLRKYLLCSNCEKKCNCIESNSYCEQQVLKAYVDSAEPREKRIAELEEKISVLLSCKNCPENKGGYICEKEYENKCLTQKIQFIKELQEENAELNDKLNNLASVAEIRLGNWRKYAKESKEAKDLIRNLLRVTYGEGWNYNLDWKVKAEEFIKE